MYEADMMNAGQCEASPPMLGKALKGSYGPPTPRQKLMRQKEELTGILARVDKALEVLDANPGIEEFLTVTSGLI